MAFETLSMGAAGALERAADIIRAGGVIAVPTETFYGLAADAANERAIARIFDIKGRPAAMSLPLVGGSIEQVEQMLGALDPRSARAAARFWPGPLSLVLPAASTLAARDATVAVRVPGHDFVRHLCERAGTLLTATSANRSGEPAAQTAGEVSSSLGDALDLIIDGGRTPGGKPSTIADLRGPEARLFRDGAIAWDDVVAAVRER